MQLLPWEHVPETLLLQVVHWITAQMPLLSGMSLPLLQAQQP